MITHLSNYVLDGELPYSGYFLNYYKKEWQYAETPFDYERFIIDKGDEILKRYKGEKNIPMKSSSTSFVDK
ncbi:MAG: hypothetical protein DI539_25015 [Flavobacterium psychrophilum]|nr:MAG: hypothetical protein DI539_25015 [Flavobacterium psychrophilum]